MYVYVASSWRNHYQQEVVSSIRQAGHEVYDFKNPQEGDNGFHWSEIDDNWKHWSNDEFVLGLRHSIAERGFNLDYSAMKKADACVLVLPCGRSAHLEAGYFIGANKALIILLLEEKTEPELMYKMATHLPVTKISHVVTLLNLLEANMRHKKTQYETPKKTT